MQVYIRAGSSPGVRNFSVTDIPEIISACLASSAAPMILVPMVFFPSLARPRTISRWFRPGAKIMDSFIAFPFKISKCLYLYFIIKAAASHYINIY